MTLFRCPICASPLARRENALRCPKGHSFDLASEGYAYLLPPDKKHSKAPGDDREMVAARAAFLEKGYYLPLREALQRLCVHLTEGCPAPMVVDSGCGEGWYTAGVHAALAAAGREPCMAGVDISKFAVRRAAKRLPEGRFAVASAYRLPLPDGCADLLLNVFSPLAAEEFARVLRSGGHFLYVVPSARHLWQMKEVLYDRPYENPVKVEQYPGFDFLGATPVRYTAALEDSADVMALFRMTPYAWKTPRAGVERLERLTGLATEIGFDIHLYRRKI